MRGEPQSHDLWERDDRWGRQPTREVVPVASGQGGFPYAEMIYPLIVDGHGRVKVKTNWYSAPLSPGWRSTAVVGPSEIEIRHDNQCVARHARCYGRGYQILNLDHYLDVLEKKPGAMAGSTPLQQWRQAGRWPAALQAL